MRTIFATALLALASPAAAQDFPTRPMTLVVPFAAGGAVDVLGRTLAARAQDILGQQIVIENVGGAGGMTGSNRVAKATPDGYQMVLGSVGTHAQNQTLYKHPAYDVMKEFAPVILVGETPLLLVTRRDFPASGLQYFIAYAKAHPGDLKFGSAGVGSAIHLGCVLFNAAAGINATHIPYRGGNPAMQDLIAGRIDYSCNIITSAYGQVRDKLIKAQALLSAYRAPLLPDLATAQEQGLTGFDAGSWNVVFVPKSTPVSIVQKINAAFGAALDTPGTVATLHKLGVAIPAPDRRSPAYAATFVQSEIEKYAGPIKASGLVIE